MKGGAYKKGQVFDVTKQQVRTGMLFTPRYYDANVTEFLEDIEVEMAGPTAVFSVVRQDLITAALTISAILEVAIFQNGQNLGAGKDRSAELNGFEEGFINAVDTSLYGNVFPSYGGQDRVSVSPALNSPTGLIPMNAGPGLNYRVLEHSFLSTVIGSEHPTLGVTSNRGMGFMMESFQPQQRIDTMEPEIGWPGIKFQGGQATIVVSQYAPSQDGTNDPGIGNYSATSEPFLWLNPGPQGEDAYIRLYIAQSPKFAFGFTGFKGARDDNQVSGQILFGGNLTLRAPRLSRFMFGFTK